MYFLKDICCLCLNSKRIHMKYIDDLASSGITYLKKLATIIPELSFKKMKKCPQQLVCDQCCQQIDQMHRFRVQSLINQNIFVEYVHQLSFFDDVDCQLSVCLTDLQHLHCIKNEPTETINECQNENESLYNADLPIKQEFQEIVVVKNELECCSEMSKLDCINSKHCHQLDEISDLRHSSNDLDQCSSALYIENGDIKRLQSSNVQVCTPVPEQQHDLENTIHAGASYTPMKRRHEGVGESCMQRSALLGRFDDCAKKLIQRKHLKKHTGERPVHQCNECGKKFTRPCDLKRHKLIHSGERPYECKLCNKKFTQLHILIDHKRIHSGERPYECKVCGVKFNRVHHLKCHERIHSGERPYECKECCKKFSALCNLKIHERIHSGERPYECKQCNKKFTQLHALIDHKRIHSGERPHECKECCKKFTRFDTLKKHERVHSAERPYECKQCNKKFTQLHVLIDHKRIHSGERPHECKECCKKFTRLDILKTHQRIHSGELPYECKVCGKKFNRVHHLKSHERIHSGERPYECKECLKKFTRLDNLKKHQRIHIEGRSTSAKNTNTSSTSLLA